MNAIRDSVRYDIDKAARELDAEEQEEVGEAEEGVPVDDPVPAITKAHFEEALSRARKSVKPEDIEQYKNFAKNLKDERGFNEFSFDELEKRLAEEEAAAAAGEVLGENGEDGEEDMFG
ncbi:unnamed protein product [Choristocarpus tenellus]